MFLVDIANNDNNDDYDDNTTMFSDNNKLTNKWNTKPNGMRSDNNG